jgi:hypothetical protein
MASIVVSGYMLRYPFAGTVATYVQYLLGLHALGHDVLYVEGRDWPHSCRETYTPTGSFPRAGYAQVRELLRRKHVDIPIVWVDENAGLVAGMIWPELRRRLKHADLLLDIGATCQLDERASASRRALLDIDPTTAARKSSEPEDYDTYFSYAVNIGTPGCSMPTHDLEWHPTIPPVVPQLWTTTPPQRRSPLTCLGHWPHAAKRHPEAEDNELQQLLDLAAHVVCPVELAIPRGSTHLRGCFTSAGWSVRDASDVTALLSTYHDYIRNSQAQLSPSDHTYTTTRSGWISSDSVHYLAAGRPAIIQDTGLGEWLTSNSGLLTFNNLDDAIESVGRVTSELTKHSHAARKLTDRVFHYRTVLQDLLRRALPRDDGALHPGRAAIR